MIITGKISDTAIKIFSATELQVKSLLLIKGLVNEPFVNGFIHDHHHFSGEQDDDEGSEVDHQPASHLSEHFDLFEYSVERLHDEHIWDNGDHLAQQDQDQHNAVG